LSYGAAGRIDRRVVQTTHPLSRTTGPGVLGASVKAGIPSSGVLGHVTNVVVICKLSLPFTAD
jgi:hypothetical protein